MTDVVLSEAKSLTPLVPPHDVIGGGGDDTSTKSAAATIVSASSSNSSSGRNAKNMRARVRKVRGSSHKIGKERLTKGNSNPGVEDKPQYKDYLAEQRARRQHRFKPKGRYDGRKDLGRGDDGGGDNEVSKEVTANGDDANGDSGRGVSAGSNGSKDEGIHSNGEKDEDQELLESAQNKTDSSRVEEEGEEEEEAVEDDEGRGSINDEEGELPALSDGENEGEKEETKSARNDSEDEKEEEDPKPSGDNSYLDASGYHAELDEPNSLATSYEDSLGISSDAGLGTTYDLTLLRSGLEDMLQIEKDGGEKEGVEEVEAGEKEGGDDVLLQTDEKNEEDEGTDAGETSGQKDEEMDEADPKMDDIKEEDNAEKEELAESEEEKEDNEEEAKDSGDEHEDDAEPAEVKDGTPGDGGTSDKEEEGREEENSELGETEKKEEESGEEDGMPVIDEDEEAEEDSKEEGESLQKIDEDEENELKVGSEKEEEGSDKEDTMEDKEEKDDDDDAESQEEDEAKDEQAEMAKPEGEEEEEEEEEGNKEEGEGNDQPESTKNQEQEEDIEEIPAIARIPGRRPRRRIIPGKTENLQKKAPTSKIINMNKVASNRKPISYRSGPIQTSSRVDINKTVPGRHQRRQNNFKAKSMIREDAVEKADDETSKENDGETADEGESQASQEERSSSIADSEPQDMPPVNINKSGDNDLLGALETSRSVGQVSVGESQEYSLMDSNFQDISRPRTAGKKYRENRGASRRGGKLSSSRKSSVSQPRKNSSSTSEVWVPEEDKLYVYTYSSQPRLLQVRRMGARVATTDKWDNDPNSSFRLKKRGNGNPMYDRRVVRGSNYAKRIEGDGLPKWNPYFSNARSLTQVSSDAEGVGQGGPSELSQSQQLRRQEFRQRLEERARNRRGHHGVSSLYPSHNASNAHNFHRNYARAHVHVQTENHYEPLERPPESETGIQTDPWSAEEGGFVAPPVAPSVPGVDAATQVFDAELIDLESVLDAESDDDALVAALVGRTMREAVLEVAREEQAEETRINTLATAALSSFLKPEGSQMDQDGEDKGDDVDEKATSGEREEPEGKETTPEGTDAPRTPDVISPAPNKDISDVTQGQEHESLVN